MHIILSDRTPPSTRFIGKYEPLSRNPAERIRWSSDETVTYRCKVGERQEVDCGRGLFGEFTTPELPDGEHVFQVMFLAILGHVFIEARILRTLQGFIVEQLFAT